jgi:DNA-binding NtrC family response regulator
MKIKKHVEYNFEGMIGKSAGMAGVYTLIKQVAGLDVPVLITGESGTGKELVAKAVHRLSNRRNETFIAINTGAIARDLIESELFGHEKGSFTGASSRKMGKFEAASEGTLFLDEVSTMNTNTQVSLLRVLETKKFQRIGGTSTIKSHARIIAASNEDLEKMIQIGEFRRDLYHRLNVFRIDLPPLRDRPEDIPLLVNHFVCRYAKEFGKQIALFSDEAVKVLEGYEWPGNVRELENVIMRLCITTQKEEIAADFIPAIMEGADPIAESHSESHNKDSVEVKVGTQLVDAERELIIKTLEKLNGKKGEAAKVLGISRKALYNKIKEYGLKN